MTKHNQPPNIPEKEHFAHPEMVQFNDREMAIYFRTPGDKLPLGPASLHKHAQHFDLSNMAIIETKSGNAYALAHGVVLNRDRQLAYELPLETFEVTIGKPCVIPGVGSTSDVESVMLRWKVAAPDSDMADHQVDMPSPFSPVQDMALEAKARLENK